MILETSSIVYRNVKAGAITFKNRDSYSIIASSHILSNQNIVLTVIIGLNKTIIHVACSGDNSTTVLFSTSDYIVPIVFRSILYRRESLFSDDMNNRRSVLDLLNTFLNFTCDIGICISIFHIQVIIREVHYQFMIDMFIGISQVVRNNGYSGYIFRIIASHKYFSLLFYNNRAINIKF